MKPPAISVLLPVYNGAPYLGEAIQSILNQAFDDFELIIINDGSRDNSEAIIQRFTDSRIRYTAQSNQGLAQTLNTAIIQSRGSYLARQDQDDVSHPMRFAEQKTFLDHHPQYAVIGSSAKILVENKPTRRFLNHPTTSEAAHFAVLFDTPFVHSSVMMHKNIIAAAGLYTTDKNRQPPEDYELWSKLFASKFANLSHPLLTYRETKSSMSRDKHHTFTNTVIRISAENIAKVSHRKIDDPLVVSLSTLAHHPYPGFKPSLPELKQFYLALVDNFKSDNKIAEKELQETSNRIWSKIHYNYSPNPLTHVSFKMNQLGNKLRGYR